MITRPVKPLVVATALSCAGCGTFIDAQDRAHITDFRRLSATSFEYDTDLVVPDGADPRSLPVGHDRWLNDWLTQNAMCANGYQIRDARFVRSHGALLGTVHKATYVGQCN